MSVVLGLPKKLLPSPEASLSEGCKSQWVKIQPNNVASVVSGTTTVAASTNYNQMSFPSQEIRFSVPVGQGKNVWLDTSKTTLSFRAKYEVSTASVGSATITGNLISNGLAWFDRIQMLNSNGNAVEDVTGLSLVEHHKQLYNFDAAERDSMALAYGYRFQDEATDSRNDCNGHTITNFSTTTTLGISSSYYSYDIPFPSSLIGVGAKGFCPVGALQKLDCYLTTNAIQPILIAAGSGISTSAVVKVTLDNFSINAYYLTLDDKSAALLGSPKIHYLHGITNRTSNSTLNSGITGQVSTLIGVRGQSVRSLSTRFSENAYTTAGSLNGAFDSKMPLCSQLNYFLQGKDRVPPNPHNTNNAPASVFLHALQASEAFTEKAMKFGGVPWSFTTYLATGTAPTAANGYDQNIVDAGSDTYVASLQSFSFSEDLRKASTSAILDGYNMSQSANNYLEMNITNAPTNTIYCTFISSQDVIYLIDMEQGSIDYRL